MTAERQTEKITGQTGYEAGMTFLKARINEAREERDKHPEHSYPWFQAQEDLEQRNLQMKQLIRRETYLK